MALRHNLGEKKQCRECTYKTANAYSFTEHAEIHSGITYSCSQCDYTGLKSKLLADHVQNMHIKEKMLATPRFNCDICDYKSSEKGTLKRHKNLRHDQGVKEQCKYCEYKSANRYSLNVHMEKHKGMTFSCDQCDYTSNGKLHLRNHIKNMHIKKPDACPWSECEFTSKNLRQHINFKHKGINFPCEQCDYKAAGKDMLRSHIQQQHDKSTIFKCDQCEHTTVNHGNLQKHILYIHCPNRLNCQHCEFKTITKGMLAGHMLKMHKDYSDILTKFETKISNFDENAKDKINQCPICEKHYETTSQFTAHKKRCMKKDPVIHKCVECVFIAETGTLLSKHINATHEREKYSCTKCAYKTNSNGSMVRHKGLVHKEGNLNKCISCDYKTAATFLMKQHTQTAHGNMIFSCKYNQCTFSAKASHLLKRHSRNIHEKQIYTCSENNCDTNFKSRKNASKHALNVHKKTFKIGSHRDKDKQTGNIQSTNNYEDFDKESQTELLDIKLDISSVDGNEETENNAGTPDENALSDSSDDESVLQVFAEDAGSLLRTRAPGVGQAEVTLLLARVWREMPANARRAYRARGHQA
jgi:KRAB domain-containing zinc finger protein